ncbi:DUF6431 domain-containing protein [Longicatena caecimuris]|uniref:DUF6431 domain-containing protein n=1 Tax=Longicatena caecimuris TaxID=1796635 RepID=UPI00353041F2
MSFSSCSHNDWAFHASYSRKIDSLDRELHIIISRVICKHCGKIHDILIQDLIPYSLLPHDTIISVLFDLDPYIVSSPHRSFLEIKYSFLDFTIMILSVRLIVDFFLSYFILHITFDVSSCFFRYHIIVITKKAR